MGNLNRLALMLVAAAAAAATQWPALAQCRLCDTPTTSPEIESADGPVRLEIETSLDFDRLIVAGVGTGSAMLRPDGTSSAEGVVTQVGPRAMVGTVLVRGEPGRAL